MKKPQRNSFKLNPVAAAIAMAMASQFAINVAYAGSGFGSGMDISNTPKALATYFANSPVGPVPQLDAAGNPVTTTVTDPVTLTTGNIPAMVDSGKALRKFVDTLPGMGSAKVNNLGQYIPVAIAEKWVDSNGIATSDDYYEIAAVEYSEKMHSDLPKATHLRGYVQLMTPGLLAKGVAGKSFTTLDGRVLSVVDNPHHLGPIINSTKGTAVRVKFTNLLPVGGELFIPVDTTITGAGTAPDGTAYTQNRAGIHLVGGQSPWISAGTPHQWVAPADDPTTNKKGVSAQNVPDMADPGAGSTTLYFPNDISARFTFYQDRTSGLTRLNSYAGLEAGYLVTDNAEQALIVAGTIPAAADTIPLIIEDKTFVPGNVAQQDAKWSTTHWGQPGDLWFPHVYETNQADPAGVVTPAMANGANPVGRWDFGPLFWPIFPAKDGLPTGEYGKASFTPEAYLDTPVINGTAYPTLTVDPKAYRLRILNASNDRYINLGLYKADTTVKAPLLDLNGNPTFDANGVQQFIINTEVKMVPAVADTLGNPVGWDAVNGVQLPLPQYPSIKTNINAEPSGPSRAWPVDARIGGAPDPTTAGPDFIVIGNDGGLLPNPVDIPAQPVTYEANRRSITVGNIYGYGLLLGPAERADTIVDFSAYAGQTLILYNDAPAPTPFVDTRNDYYTGNPDQTGQGGAYSTLPGYGPNTRTMMQIVVSNNAASPTYDPTALVAALPAAYGAAQPKPIVPAVAYNVAFGTNDTDIYAHVATGSAAQPTLDFSTSVGGAITLTGLTLVTSGGQVGGAGNPIPGSGTGYDPLNPPTVVFNNTVNGVTCLGAGGLTASATAVVDPGTPAVLRPNGTIRTPAIPSTGQVTGITNWIPGSGYTCAPVVTFTNPPGTNGVGAQATVNSTNMMSIPVLTKAEQELFDTHGRYNSTGGVELPLTNGLIQTTVPLNYIDSATEILGDNEVQIWKLVDNGFWSNSIRFDMVDVQLINRVGWDGTVKAPATNEVGWKDTLRLNPLEDVIVAMRAKRPTIPFGLPQSKRSQDPSVALGKPGSGLGFTVDPGVVSPTNVALLTTTTNVSATYDNEFTWGSAILGHSEDDFTRPVVFHPTITRPAAPTNLAGTGGSLSWTDPTPAGQVASLPGVVPVLAATLANPQNEIGFKVLRATYAANGNNLGAYSQIGTAPANATSYADVTQAAGTDYSYEVAAWNAAGTTTSAAYAEVTAPAVPTWAANAVVISPTGATVTWNKVTGATGYILTVNGTAMPVINSAGNGATQSSTLTFAVGSVNIITVSAQKVRFGKTATSAASAAVTADMTMPSAPAAPTAASVAATTLTLSWSAASGATSYNVQRATNAAFTGTVTTIANGVTGLSRAVTGLTANTTYYFRVVAVNGVGNVNGTASAAQLTLLATPTANAANGTNGGAITGGLTWGAVAGATSYIVNWTGPNSAPTNTGSATATSGQQITIPGATANTIYSMTVKAVNATTGNISAPSNSVNVTVR